MNYALELKNVCKQYDGFALKDVNIALPQGALWGLSVKTVPERAPQSS